MATHSSVLAWRIPGMGEPGGLPSMGSHRVGHDWSDAAAATAVFVYLFCIYPTWCSLIFIFSLVSDIDFGRGGFSFIITSIFILCFSFSLFICYTFFCPIVLEYSVLFFFAFLLFNMLSRLVIIFLPRSKRLLISWLQSVFVVILEPKNINQPLFPQFPHVFGMKWWDWMPWS